MESEVLRGLLGIGAEDFPVILHGGEGAHARQDFAIWTSAVMAQLYPRARLILREDGRTGTVPGLERYGADLPDEELVVAASYEMTWADLLSVADVFLVTATGPIPTGSVVEAMSAGVPVVGTPLGCVKELIRHGETGLVAKHVGVGIAPPMGRKTIRPRAIAGELERLLSTPGMAEGLEERARAEAAGFEGEGVVEAYQWVYDGLGVMSDVQ
jgi:glycosyltransferase involved in cell wall biosynthesis